MAQLLMVLADGGVGGRHGAEGYAGVEATQRQQCVLQVVFAENGHRTFGVQAAVDQRLADAPRAVQRFAVGNAAPVTGGAVGLAHASRHEDAVRRGAGPVHQAIGQPRRVLAQRLLGLHVTHPAGAFAQDHPAHGKLQGPVLRRAHFMLSWLRRAMATSSAKWRNFVLIKGYAKWRDYGYK
jgi:hypothetical protein